MSDTRFKRGVFLRPGVVTSPGKAPLAITGAYLSEDGKQLQFEGNTDPNETWTIQKLNIIPRSGTMYFRSKGAEYTVRELRDNDGLWLSQYKIPLPEETLGALIRIGGQMLANEQFVAVATEDSPYVVALTYSNGTGTYVRQNGSWVKAPANDTTFDSMIPMPIASGRARDFLKLYDANYVSVSDAQAYTGQATNTGAPEDRPAEEA